MSARRPLLAALAAIPALLCSTSVWAQSAGLRTEAFQFKTRDGGSIAAERGWFSVPENRAKPGSRQIEIGFVRLKSTSAKPGAPIVYLAGGPGGSGSHTLQGPRQAAFVALTAVADVIALDQRGVNMSDAIPPCAADAPFDIAAPMTEATFIAEYRRTLATCAVRWKAAGVDLNGYTTVENAADIEALRGVLGAPRLSLMGTSYGTHLGLAMLKAYPESIERIAFSSVEGLDQTVKLPARVDAAFGRIDAALDADLVATMRRVHARYATPQPMTVTAPDGKRTTFRIDAFVLRMMAGFMAKNPAGHARLVQLYEALDQGQGDAVAAPFFDNFFAEPLGLTGMTEAMDMASGVSPRRLAAIKAQAPTSLLALATNAPMPQLAGALPGLDLGEAFRREAKWSGPALIFSGDMDIRTPLEEQAEAIAGLPGRVQIIVRNGGHDLFEADPAIAGLLVDFFAGRPVAATPIILPRP